MTRWLDDLVLVFASTSFWTMTCFFVHKHSLSSLLVDVENDVGAAANSWNHGVHVVAALGVKVCCLDIAPFSLHKAFLTMPWPWVLPFFWFRCSCDFHWRSWAAVRLASRYAGGSCGASARFSSFLKASFVLKTVWAVWLSYKLTLQCVTQRLWV